MSEDETKSVVAKAFQDAADDYERVGPEFFDRFGRELVARAGLRPGMRVLDLGSGTGAALLPAAAEVGAAGRALGVDLAPGMVARLDRALTAAGLRHAEARVGDAEDPPADEAGWDRILAAHMLFFLPNLTDALARYQRLLRPDGVFACSTWGAEFPEWKPVYEALYGQIPAGTMPRLLPQREAFASDDALRTALETAGFGKVEHETVAYEVEYRDPAQWLEWNRSHGARAFWDAIPAEKLAASRDAAKAALEPLRRPDGVLPMPIAVRYTIAHRA
ncbi:methyltransferase domain-containing protein [Natronosporangium hydrolyticum]|uniref:Methyltransferase domain-containing protein n=1 Tax=Natronosporangium hydrolyticum TaxID=2811111 RepID=A0A895YRE4_9ACTN|nr:methyltransferase domain-containing protein [Natronosporangium hydrolyticum]QSB16588.1 methyltransferase domain-containing protein [Natronosporangium hydrolyticum]